MICHEEGAGRAITDYFNSPAFHAPKESERIAEMMAELMQVENSITSETTLSGGMTTPEAETDVAPLPGEHTLPTPCLHEQIP